MVICYSSNKKLLQKIMACGVKNFEFIETWPRTLCLLLTSSEVFDLLLNVTELSFTFRKLVIYLPGRFAGRVKNAKNLVAPYTQKHLKNSSIVIIHRKRKCKHVDLNILKRQAHFASKSLFNVRVQNQFGVRRFWGESTGGSVTSDLRSFPEYVYE